MSAVSAAIFLHKLEVEGTGNVGSSLGEGYGRKKGEE